ncbi:hypothetical protein [Bacillus sp. AK031]
MAGFLYGFGLIVFIGSFAFCVMSFVGDSGGGMVFVGSVFGMLNAAIAMAVSDILVKVSQTKTKENGE